MSIVTFDRNGVRLPSSRAAIEDAIERLLAVLDVADGDPESEPSLGWSSTYSKGSGDDREDDAGDAAEMDDDREWSLSRCEHINQCSVHHGDNGDLEQDRVPA